MVQADQPHDEVEQSENRREHPQHFFFANAKRKPCTIGKVNLISPFLGVWGQKFVPIGLPQSASPESVAGVRRSGSPLFPGLALPRTAADPLRLSARPMSGLRNLP